MTQSENERDHIYADRFRSDADLLRRKAESLRRLAGEELRRSWRPGNDWTAWAGKTPPDPGFVACGAAARLDAAADYLERLAFEVRAATKWPRNPDEADAISKRLRGQSSTS